MSTSGVARSLVAFTVLFIAYLPQAASASLIRWTLSGATFTDGGTASGSFLYDAATATVAEFDVTTTAGAVLAGAHYVDWNGAFPPYPANGFAVVIPAAPPFPPNAPFLGLQFASALSDAGGIISLLPGGEGFCLDVNCNSANYRRTFVGGSVRGVQVPEPGTLALLVLGVGALLLARRHGSLEARAAR